MENYEIKIFTSPASVSEIKQIAEVTFVEYAKAVVDINRRVLGVGGDLHADIEQIMLEQGSVQTDLWGINIYPEKNFPDMVVFDSLINIRPRQNNRIRGVSDPAVQAKILEVVRSLIQNA